MQRRTLRELRLRISAIRSADGQATPLLPLTCDAIAIATRVALGGKLPSLAICFSHSSFATGPFSDCRSGEFFVNDGSLDSPITRLEVPAVPPAGISFSATFSSRIDHLIVSHARHRSLLRGSKLDRFAKPAATGSPKRSLRSPGAARVPNLLGFPCLNFLALEKEPATNLHGLGKAERPVDEPTRKAAAMNTELLSKSRRRD
jgi:hypothetical protein